MILIDTDICIDLLNSYARTANWFAGLPELPALSGYTVMELFDGCHDAKEVRLVNKFAALLPSVWPTAAACQSASAAFAKQRLSHHIGVIDALIAATAMEHGARLYTFNLRHYKAVTGLDLARPYAK